MLDKKGQVLSITPQEELVFQGQDPETGISHSKIELLNPTTSRVCFKVKTTAPKRYCVRPNSGILHPQQSVIVDVMLPPSNASADEKSKHKFMVQSIVVAEDNSSEDYEAIWKAASPKEIMDCKLKCVFLSNNEQESGGQQAHVTSTIPPPAAAGQGLQGAPLASSGSGTDSNDSGVAGTIPQAHQQHITHHPNTNTGPASAAASSGVDTNDIDRNDIKQLQDLIQQLSQETNALRSENAQLREEQTLRQRLQQSKASSGKGDAASMRPASTAAAAPQGNVFPPLLYIVAAVILGIIIGKLVLP